MSNKSAKQITKELKNKKALQNCANQLGVVGDETRIKICYLLCHHPRLSVGQIAELTGISVSAASHSLKKLKDIGVLDRQRNSQTIYYSLVDNSLTSFLKSYITAAQ